MHGGVEHAVDSDPSHQEYGNPLRIRLPLSHGVKVIIAHCASLGNALYGSLVLPAVHPLNLVGGVCHHYCCSCRDLDNGGKTSVPCFELFMRMMREERWKDLLFGDISAVCLVSRMSCVKPLLDASWLHERLVNGTDYPLTK